jgi:outer membrane protein TolC
LSRLRPIFANGLAAAALLVLASCRAYEPRPLDAGASHAAWLARTAGDGSVRDFAQRLAAGSPDPTSFDPSDGLSLAEAEAVALVYNAELRIARLRLGVARATAENAGLWADPTLGVDLTRITGEAAHRWKVAAPIGLTLPISGRLEAERARADAGASAELTRVAEAEWETRITLRNAWADWSSQRGAAEVHRAFLARLEPVIAMVDRAEKAGETSRVEARLFRLEHASREADLARAEAAAAQSEAHIAHLLGLSSAATAGLVTGSGAATPTILNRPMARLLAGSPALAVARAEYEVAERSLATEVRGQYPDLQIGPGYGREDGRDEVLLGLNLSLPVWNRNRQGVAKAEAEREVSRASFDATLERICGELDAAQAQLKAAAALRESIEADGGLVSMVDQQEKEVRRLADLGELNTLVLLESLKGQHQAMLTLIESRRAERLAAIRIDELLGPEPVQGVR